MDALDLTVAQLKRAAVIKQRIEALNQELRAIFNGGPRTATPRIAKAKNRAGRRHVAPQPNGARRSAKNNRRVVSAATRAKMAAKRRAYWAAKRTAGSKK